MDNFLDNLLEMVLNLFFFLFLSRRQCDVIYCCFPDGFLPWMNAVTAKGQSDLARGYLCTRLYDYDPSVTLEATRNCKTVSLLMGFQSSPIKLKFLEWKTGNVWTASRSTTVYFVRVVLEKSSLIAKQPSQGAPVGEGVAIYVPVERISCPGLFPSGLFFPPSRAFLSHSEEANPSFYSSSFQIYTFQVVHI